MLSGVSCEPITRAEMPSAQAEAETSRAGERTSWAAKSPADSLSSMRRSAVALSGTRSSDSASTISARPSLVESEYSCRKSSMPPTPPARARIAATRAPARASMRASASGRPRRTRENQRGELLVGRRIGGAERMDATFHGYPSSCDRSQCTRNRSCDCVALAQNRLAMRRPNSHDSCATMTQGAISPCAFSGMFFAAAGSSGLPAPKRGAAGSRSFAQAERQERKMMMDFLACMARCAFAASP